MPDFPLQNKCEEKARKKNMPRFTVIACDNFAMPLLQEWIKKAVKNNVPYLKVIEAQAILEAIREWREDHPEQCKTPD